MRDDIIDLISIVIVEDEIGNPIEQETLKEVYCTVESISQSEYFQASLSGLKPQIKITVCEFDYSDEKIVLYNDKRYSIYRTYLRKDERIELYLTEKVGV
jgi:SPP1 family predicted phage head-tail adaptor